jgi:large subunit ribosomal protein L10
MRLNFSRNILRNINVIGLVSVEKISARAVQNIRKALRGKVVMHMAKKNLIARAIGESKKPNLKELLNYIRKYSAMIFTNMNPFELSKFLDTKSTKAAAKPGDIAPEDIVVKAGNTRLPPGPMISDLNNALKLPTMIKDGMIHIRTDTVTHHKGDKIDLKQATLLARLGIEPMTIKLNFYTAWENGEIIPEEVLKLDETKIINDVKAAHSTAFSLAMGLGIITPETLSPMISRAARNANALAMKLGILTPETIPLYLSQAASAAASINDMVFGGGVSEKKSEETGKDDKKKKEDEKDDDQALGEGIGSLFG